MNITRRKLRQIINEEMSRLNGIMIEAFSQDKEDEARDKIVQAVELGLGGFKEDKTFLNPKELASFENALIEVGLNPDDFNIDPGHQLPRGKFNQAGQPCTVAIYLDRHAYHFQFDKAQGIKDVE